MKLLRKLLFPFSLIYLLVTAVRNFLYNTGLFKSFTFPIPVIAIGNLSTGGTGKTPQTEYLIRLLSDKYRVATLSRGYKRKSKGFVLGNADSNADSLGDEPYQFHQKFPNINVAVDADRKNGIEELLNLSQNPEIIILDDAYQHRRVKAGFYVLLTSYGDLYADDLILPAGNLRESRSGANRADVIIVTKCPAALSETERAAITKKLKPKKSQKVYFTCIEYDSTVYSDNTRFEVNEIVNTTKVLVAGIAKPKPFFDYLQQPEDEALAFPDHHDFTDKELADLNKRSMNKIIITTEKDYMRLKGKLSADRLFYLPIKSRFLDGGADFDKTILDYVEKIQETAKYISDKTGYSPRYGVILGSGLGSFTDEMEVEFTLPYDEIPNFPVSTVEGHSGCLVFGKIGQNKVVAMKGRFHYYEGYGMDQVTFPVRVMKALGVEKLIVSNASGGVNPFYKVGDIVLIYDHINFFPEHPLRGANDERFGPRFLNMHEAYSRKMIAKAKEIAVAQGIDVRDGIYLGLQGPTYETMAEYRMVKILGADCVGMSTVPEVIVARHMNMEVFGLSVITDMGNEEGIETLSHDEVLQAAKMAEPKVKALIKELIIKY